MSLACFKPQWKKKDKLIWQSQTLLKPTSCNCFLIWPGRLNKKKKKVKRKEKKDKKKKKKDKKDKKKEDGGKERGKKIGEWQNILRKKEMEANKEIKVFVSFVVN